MHVFRLRSYAPLRCGIRNMRLWHRKAVTGSSALSHCTPSHVHRHRGVVYTTQRCTVSLSRPEALGTSCSTLTSTFYLYAAKYKRRQEMPQEKTDLERPTYYCEKETDV
ncbi:hypothetical protein BKA82DRAFT_177371 [Pisolithus tinctorius]|uniref:Uncharacterized protein n=1 Tax=Pisolithus tinctorius Marx 270 TaxID=870435 RepID=A0A0C3KYE8_PISTI|nr:hypothetical protein BKA82DRAFT_177371 [Pisolithus tinctorius]KIO14557.1 hypothetical protein M404DRAFT_177371 [Pisolithus tinctorius Marx 270]